MPYLCIIETWTFEWNWSCDSKAIVYPRDIIEYVLVNVGNLVVLADIWCLMIYIVHFASLKTSKSILDVNSGTLTMEFDDEIDDTMKYHSDHYDSIVNTIAIIDNLS